VAAGGSGGGGGVGGVGIGGHRASTSTAPMALIDVEELLAEKTVMLQKQQQLLQKQKVSCIILVFDSATAKILAG
jgi:hypothetical protein